ncbi:MAG: hypothetical protein QM820_18990 [Minicystis sp.]
MALTRFIPADQPTVKVEIDSRELPDAAYADLRRVTVSDDDRGPASFEIDMLAWDRNFLKLSWVDHALFTPGRRVKISMGYVGLMKQVMIGAITSLDFDVQAQGVPTLTVRGYDLGDQMSRTTTTSHFTKLSDFGIVDEIARKYNLTFKKPLGVTEVVHDSVVQYNQTDLRVPPGAGGAPRLRGQGARRRAGLRPAQGR